jgi:uncharacterized protein (TIGR03083 family)
MIPGLPGSPSTMSIVDLGPAAQRLADLVARVGDDELGKPTPCPAYTLGDLIEHVGGLALAFTAAANKDGGRYADQAAPGDASRLGEDWRVRIPRDLAELAAGARRRAEARPRGRARRARPRMATQLTGEGWPPGGRAFRCTRAAPGS